MQKEEPELYRMRLSTYQKEAVEHDKQFHGLIIKLGFVDAINGIKSLTSL